MLQLPLPSADLGDKAMVGVQKKQAYLFLQLGWGYMRIFNCLLVKALTPC